MNDLEHSGLPATLPGTPEPRPLRHQLRRMLVAGLLILAPTALTVWILYQIFELMDGIFAPLLSRAVGMHIPGVGFLLTLSVVLFLGWLSTNVVGRRLILIGEGFINRIPIAKSIYSATKGVVEAVSHSQTQAFKRVVLVQYPTRGVWALAFVTGSTDWSQISERTPDEMQLVFLPTTPNPTSGFLLLVPKQDVVNLPFTVEEGVRMVISGGILIPRHPLPPSRPEPAASAGAETGPIETISGTPHA